MTVKRIDYTKCSGCLRCFEVCPMDVFRQAGREIYIAYQDDCMCCYLCELECPEDAVYVNPKRSLPLTFPW